MLINSVRKGTEVGEEAVWVKEREGCVHQIFVVRQLCEKFQLREGECTLHLHT